MPTFTEADETYRAVIEGPGRELQAAFAAARAVETIDMNGTDITHAVLLRLRAFFQCQETIKDQLGKVYAAPAADFFVETVCFFLKVVLEQPDSSLSVASEKNIDRCRGAMRPDISIWRGEEVVAAIECKTQLGWARNEWREDFNAREKRLHAKFHKARLFLLVMTTSNWKGFGDDNRVGTQFFVLLNNIWPINFDPEAAANTIVHPIEHLIQALLDNNHDHQGR